MNRSAFFSRRSNHYTSDILSLPKVLCAFAEVKAAIPTGPLIELIRRLSAHIEAGERVPFVWDTKYGQIRANLTANSSGISISRTDEGWLITGESQDDALKHKHWMPIRRRSVATIRPVYRSLSRYRKTVANYLVELSINDLKTASRTIDVSSNKEAELYRIYKNLVPQEKLDVAWERFYLSIVSRWHDLFVRDLSECSANFWARNVRSRRDRGAMNSVVASLIYSIRSINYDGSRFANKRARKAANKILVEWNSAPRRRMYKRWLESFRGKFFRPEVQQRFVDKLRFDLEKAANGAIEKKTLNWESSDVPSATYAMLKRYAKSQPDIAGVVAILLLKRGLDTAAPEMLLTVQRLISGASFSTDFIFAIRSVADGRIEADLSYFELEPVRLFARISGISFDCSIDDALLVCPQLENLQYNLISRTGANLSQDTLGRFDTAFITTIRPENGLTQTAFGASDTVFVPANLFDKRTDWPATCLSFSNLRVSAYSSTEEELSSHTESLAALLIDELKNLIGDDPSQRWLDTLKLPLDDTLFSASIDFWSIVNSKELQRSKSVLIVCDSEQLAIAYQIALQELSVGAEVVFASKGLAGFETVNFNSNRSKSDEGLVRGAISSLIGDAGLSVSSDFPNGKSLLVGRSFDRNYKTDLFSLGKELQKTGEVSFALTAGKRGLSNLPDFLKSYADAWFDKLAISPLMRLFVPLSELPEVFQSGLADLLIARIWERDLLTPTNLALVMAAKPRLDAFFNVRLPRLILAGADVVRVVHNTRPEKIVLLPGRDYISQVAAYSGREIGAKSFDVQTVFVGPRSRYKASVADYQFVIETYSQKIFEDFFGVPKEKLVLAGNSKVGGVQTQIRKLDRKKCRSKAGLLDEFLITFACSPILHDDQEVIDALASVVGVIPGARLAFRYHPTAHQEYFDYCNAIAQGNDAIFIADMLDLPETLLASDLVVTRFSNVGLEAALAGRNVISCNFSGKRFPISLDEMGVAILVDEREKLLSTLQDIQEQGVIWQKLQESRLSYIEANPQLFHDSPPQAMCEFMRSVSR